MSPIKPMVKIQEEEEQPHDVEHKRPMKLGKEHRKEICQGRPSTQSLCRRIDLSVHANIVCILQLREAEGRL